MADEIRQDLGFDAAQALDTLQKLNAGFDSLFQTLNAGPRLFDAFNQKAGKTVAALIQMRSQATQTATALAGIGAGPTAAGAAPSAGTGAAITQAQQLTTAINQSGAAAAQAGAAAQQMGNQASQSMNRAARSASGFALSVETVARVIGTQFIVRGLSAIQRQIESSFNSFIEFQNGLATIRTITPQSFASLTEELVGLSNAYNIPLLDVVQAKYEIIQNGFESTAESADILNAALKFARITNADAAASADLLSSALNAGGQAASEAELETAKLVRTIDIGRISGQQLVTALGRVKPVAEEIGAAGDEILAAFSSISIGGVNANEVATQIRATLTALLKPSEAMKDAFKELGIASGDQAVQTFGVKGALDALIATTNGSTSSIAKLFPNVRALNGVLRTTGTGAAIFEEHLKQIQATSTEILNQKFALRIDTNAEAVTNSLNQLKNFLTTEVGASFVEAAGAAIQFAGGTTTVINIARSLIPTIGGVTLALVGYQATTLAASGVSKLFTFNLREMNTAAKIFAGTLKVVGLGLAAFQAGRFIGSEITDFFNKERDQRLQEAKQLLQLEREKDGARLQLSKVAAQERLRELNKQVADAQRIYFKEVDAAQEANELLISNNKSTMSRIVETREKFAQDLRRAAQEAEDAIVDSRRESNNLITKLDDERFNRENAKLSEFSQLQNERVRREQVTALAQKQLRSANTDEEIRAARASFDRAESFSQQALETAKTLGSTSLIRQEEQRIEQLTRQRIQSELRFQKIKEQQAARLRDEAAKEEARAGKMKILADEFLSKAKLFDGSGNPLPAKEVEKNVEAAKKALAEFRQLAFDKTGSISIGDLVAFDSLERRLQQTVTDQEITALEASAGSLTGIRNQIQGALDQEDFIISLAVKTLKADPERFKDLSRADALNETTNIIQESGELFDKQEAGNVKRLDLERRIAASQAAGAESFTKALTEGERRVKLLQLGISRALGGTLQETFSQQAFINDFRARIQKAFSSPNLTQDFVGNLESSLRDFQDNAQGAFNLDIEDALHELAQLRSAAQAQAEIKALEAEGITPEALQRARDNLGVSEAREKVEAATQVNLGSAAASTNSAAAASTTWASNTERLAAASTTIATNLAAAALSMSSISGSPIPAPTAAIGATASIATQAPRTVTPGTLATPQVAGATNVNVTQNITSNNAEQIARQLVPAINREIRRNASALRTT